MMADVTDLALLKFKAKQEGAMYSAMETLQSIAQAATGFAVNWRLDELGYVNDGTQPAEVQIYLRYYFCCIPAGVYILVWLLSLLYTLDRKKHRKILKDIQYSGNLMLLILIPIRKLREEIDVTGDILGSSINTASLNMDIWEPQGTVRLQREKTKLVNNAIVWIIVFIFFSFFNDSSRMLHSPLALQVIQFH